MCAAFIACFLVVGRSDNAYWELLYTAPLLTGLAEPIAVPEDTPPAGEAPPHPDSTPPTQRTSTESSPRS